MAPVVKFSLRFGKGKTKLKYAKIGDENIEGDPKKLEKKGGAGTEIYLFKHKEKRVSIEWGWGLWYVFSSL